MSSSIDMGSWLISTCSDLKRNAIQSNTSPPGYLRKLFTPGRIPFHHPPPNRFRGESHFTSQCILFPNRSSAGIFAVRQSQERNQRPIPAAEQDEKESKLYPLPPTSRRIALKAHSLSTIFCLLFSSGGEH
ncbi:hypothetical protein CDAR_601721 [Caerostris darwini]|uniref:Uncharacterized protein n=1 Tax=Caerostris darwini TaxID=1538125 RepID=A0AAV4P5P5_9ARAC|nr:hypothetical protein CDAR_601721 [Caerostris darwini]